MSKSKSGKKVLVVIDENEADVENKLRQTTLSQVFKNELSKSGKSFDLFKTLSSRSG
jgi:hypothetical protein